MRERCGVFTSALTLFPKHFVFLSIRLLQESVCVFYIFLLSILRQSRRISSFSQSNVSAVVFIVVPVDRECMRVWLSFVLKMHLYVCQHHANIIVSRTPNLEYTRKHTCTYTCTAGKHETKMILFGAEAVNTRCNYYLKKRLYTEIIKHLLVFFHRSFFVCVVAMCVRSVCQCVE